MLCRRPGFFPQNIPMYSFHGQGLILASARGNFSIHSELCHKKKGLQNGRFIDGKTANSGTCTLSRFGAKNATKMSGKAEREEAREYKTSLFRRPLSPLPPLLEYKGGDSLSDNYDFSLLLLHELGEELFCLLALAPTAFAPLNQFIRPNQESPSAVSPFPRPGMRYLVSSIGGEWRGGGLLTFLVNYTGFGAARTFSLFSRLFSRFHIYSGSETLSSRSPLSVFFWRATKLGLFFFAS